MAISRDRRHLVRFDAEQIVLYGAALEGRRVELSDHLLQNLLSPLFGGLSAHTTINSTLATPSLLVTATVGSRIPKSVEKAVTAPPTGSSSSFLTSAVMVTAPPK